MDKKLLFSIKESELKTLLQVKYCKAQDNIRPTLKGMCFNANNGQLETCCLDEYRVSKRVLENIQINDSVNFVLDNESILKLYKTSQKNNNIVNIYMLNGYIEFEFINEIINCTLIDCNYINYNQIIPQDKQELELNINAKEVLKAIKAIKESGNQGYIKNNIIKLNIKNDNLVIAAKPIKKEYSELESVKYQNERQHNYNNEFIIRHINWDKKVNKAIEKGKILTVKEPIKKIAKFQKVYLTSELDEVKVNIPCKIKRNNLEDNFEIGFNIKYMYEAIKLYKDNIIMKFNNSVSPCVITKDNKNLELILPVRLHMGNY